MILPLLALWGTLTAPFPPAVPLPAPALAYRELRLSVEAPVVAHGPPWLHLYRDGADWGGHWHLMGWDAQPAAGPDYQQVTLYLVRLPPGNGKLVAFTVGLPASAVAGSPRFITQLTLTTHARASAANRDMGLGALWLLCEGSP